MTFCKYHSTLFITLCGLIVIGYSKERVENQHSLPLNDKDLYMKIDSLISTGNYTGLSRTPEFTGSLW